MAQQPAICKICMVKDKEPKIIEDKMRFHEGECYENYIKQKEFKKKEEEQKDELYYKLLTIHGLKNTQEIPKLFYIRMEEIRNDSVLLGKVNKKYKQGVPYNAISYTYDFCKEKIDYALKIKQFNSKLNEMSYCLAIIQNSIVDSYNDKLNKIKYEQTQSKLSQQQTTSDMSFVPAINKEKKDDMDISGLL